MSNLKKYQNCLFCGLKFMPVDFLIYRLNGYCTEGCMAHEKATPHSDVDIAYRNGFPLRKASFASSKEPNNSRVSKVKPFDYSMNS